MSYVQRVFKTRLAGLRGRRLRSIDRARLLLGSSVVMVFALGGTLALTSLDDAPALRALGQQTALMPSLAVASDTAPKVDPPEDSVFSEMLTPAPAPAPAPAPEAAPARAAAPAPEAAARPAADAASADEGSFFQEGHTSYYAHEFAGRPTASGERFNPEAMTAAHKTLALGTRIRVTNTANGRSVVVRVNDRGPFIRGRILDLSLGAARVLGLSRSGGGNVRIHVLGRGPARVREAARPEPATRRPAETPSAYPAADEILADSTHQ